MFTLFIYLLLLIIFLQISSFDTVVNTFSCDADAKREERGNDYQGYG